MSLSDPMALPSPEVEELAELVRDNLHTKHLVLSMEQFFVEYMLCPISSEHPLALEPMASYQRMLLHRLADLFGLVHESVGEGDDRHIVIEKCEESMIPAVWVSDVLEAADAAVHDMPFCRQVLKRDILPVDGFQTPREERGTSLSLEDRQAAYFAARQRIFSGSRTSKSSEEFSTEVKSVRPKSDPVVARRMIVHALGRPAKLAVSSTQPGSLSGEDVDLGSSSERNEGTGSERGSRIWNVESAQSAYSRQDSSVRAARRLFSNALGILQPGLSPRGSLRAATRSASSESREDSRTTSSLQRTRDVTCSRSTSVAGGGKRADQSSLHATQKYPGIAARRIFAQALGLLDPACARDINSPA